MPRNTLIATLVAATLATMSAIAPASAGGQVSIDIKPGTAQEAQAMRTGFALYSVVTGLQNGANINQLGINNLAGIAQNGGGNVGIVHQQGNGHSGTLQQNGNNNSYGIFQFGQNSNANVVQNGNGETGATVVLGW